VNAPVKLAAVSAENHLCKAVIAGEAAFLACRADVDYPATDKLRLHLHEELLWNDCLVVALSLPGTSDVAGMFDERRLRLMKPTAILLNVGRGNSVVTDDLVRVLQSGHLRAACLDVMDPEPLPPEHPLWTAPRAYLTPHISGGFRAGVNYGRVLDVVLGNLERVLKGEPPIHAVDRKLGY